MPTRWLDGRALGDGEPLPAAGDGVFETLRCERGAPILVAPHLARMERGARLLGLAWPPPFDPRAALAEAARSDGGAARVLRLAWTPPHLVLAARALEPVPRAPLAWIAEPGALEPPRPHGAKTTRRGEYDARRAEALRSGAFDVLVRTAGGELVEGTATNLFVAARGELATPPLASGALPGVARGGLLAALARAPLRDAEGRDWTVRERPIDAGELSGAEEVLLTSSVVGVLGLAALSDRAGALAPRADLPGTRGALARALAELWAGLEAASVAAGGSSRPDRC